MSCLFSTAVWVTAVLIQSVGSEQKLQMAARWKSGQLDFGRLVCWTVVNFGLLAPLTIVMLNIRMMTTPLTAVP